MLKMRRAKQIVTLTLIILIASCCSRTDKKDFEHKYLKYWDKYTEQQLIDTLFSDTLDVGPDTEGGWTSREFYINTTKELISDLQDDKNKIDSLYPMTSFDEVTIKKLPLGFKKTLSDQQIEKLLEIINDPVSFDWGETTYKPKYRIDFSKRNIVVAKLTINEDKIVIKTESNWPEFKKMKFGCLKSQPFTNFTKLIDETQ